LTMIKKTRGIRQGRGRVKKDSHRIVGSQIGTIPTRRAQKDLRNPDFTVLGHVLEGFAEGQRRKRLFKLKTLLIKMSTTPTF